MVEQGLNLKHDIRFTDIEVDNEGIISNPRNKKILRRLAPPPIRTQLCTYKR
ncbi:MAG: hypothetical protein ABL984_02900 [Pyrinomonadaceae bacterium]